MVGDRIAAMTGDAPIMVAMTITGTGGAVTTAVTTSIVAVVMAAESIATSGAMNASSNTIVGNFDSLNAKATIVRQSVSARRWTIDTATSSAIGKWPAETATIAPGTGCAMPASACARNSVQLKEGSQKWLPFFDLLCWSNRCAQCYPPCFFDPCFGPATFTCCPSSRESAGLT